jgi:hypothetical protein
MHSKEETPMATECIAQLTLKCYPKTKTVAERDPTGDVCPESPVQDV